MPKNPPVSSFDVFKHQISSDITAISCELESFLLEHAQFPLPTGNKLHQLLNHPRSNVERALCTTRHLIGLLQPRQSTSLALEQQRFHLASLLAELFHTFSAVFPLIKESSLDVIPRHHLYGNPHRLRLALSHLLNNAAESYQQTHPRKRVILNAVPCALGVLLTITDYGRGLTKSQLTQITQLNYSTKSHSQGIGLWETHHIVCQEFSGTLRFASLPNKGTTVGVFLPCEEE